MSTSFWLIFGSIFAVCAYLFTKTVSSDAQNDLRLRDILSSSAVDMDEAEQFAVQNKGFRFQKEKPEPVAVAAVKPEVKEEVSGNSYSANYSTTMHDNNTEDYHTNSLPETKKSVHEESYYQKDRCMVTDKVNEPEEKEPERTVNPEPPVQRQPQKLYKSVPDYDESDDELYLPKNEPQKQRKGLLYYTKTFWRGITFTFGLLACLYGLDLFVFSTSDPTIKLVASVWVLIGVILLK